MFSKSYGNFVRPTAIETRANPSTPSINNITGDEAKRLYLEEVKDVKNLTLTEQTIEHFVAQHENKYTLNSEIHLSDKDLFITVQNNDVETLKRVLDNFPDKINIVDDYGWSLLMIACQANSVETAKELLNRGISMSTRDKAGNSARSLVIKNKNLILADVLLNHKLAEKHDVTRKVKHKKPKSVQFLCEICNNLFLDKEEHLRSTLHNINASKGKKIPTKYLIPESNKGYQIMLKGGWDKESGLGPDGSGNRYPIKAVPKQDKKGLGHEKKKGEETKKDNKKYINKKILDLHHQNNRKMEINFRRQFY